MMRPISLVCMLLAVGSGLYLYRVKHRAQMLDREIHATLRAVDETRARAAMLRADYALLNDPTRLQELVALHLPLTTTQPGQFTILAEMERRLPPVGLAPPEPPPEPEIPTAIIRPETRVPMAQAPGSEPRIAEPRAAEPRVVEPPRAPPVVAAAPPRPAPQPPAQVAAAPPRAITPTPQAAPAVVAPRGPVSLALPAPSSAPTPGPVAARSATRVPAAPSTPVAMRNPPASAAPPRVARVAPQAAEPAPVVVRSSLGMARRLASPINPSVSPNGGGAN